MSDVIHKPVALDTIPNTELDCGLPNALLSMSDAIPNLELDLEDPKLKPDSEVSQCRLPISDAIHIDS